MRIVKENLIFETKKNGNGRIFLYYFGRTDSNIQQWIRWRCDDDAEVKEMIEACIDPERSPDDEYTERHKEELFASCKW